MSTDGLNPHSLRWVQQQRMEHLRGLQGGGGRKLGIPPPEKYVGGRGQFPRGIVPLYSGLGSESDEDDFSDTENEVDEGRYSIDPSPQNDILKGKSNGRYNQCSSDGYSDFSSSRDSERKERRYEEEEEEEEEEDEEEMSFDGSSEFVGKVRDGINGCDGGEPVVNSKVSNPNDVKVAVSEDSNSDVPTASPFHVSYEKFSQLSDQIPPPEAYGSTCSGGSNGYSAKKEACSQTNVGSSAPNQKTGHSLGVEGNKLSSSLPVRVPKFHTSEQGPWYYVIAYNACVRLCLHSWARGCMEAPLFLENECTLLRNAFGQRKPFRERRGRCRGRKCRRS